MRLRGKSYVIVRIEYIKIGGGVSASECIERKR